MLNSRPNMAAKKSPQKQSKFAFIRNQPPTLSAAEVVAKGKAKGLKFDVTYVHKARRMAKAKKITAKKTSARPKSLVLVSKADFVRAHANLSPKEVVAKAKAKGVKFDAQYVYNVRAYDKTRW
jgi:hypothetical protein